MTVPAADSRVCFACGALLPAPAIRAIDRWQGTPGTFGVARCELCGAGRTYPRMDDTDLGRLYGDEYAPYTRVRGLLAIVSLLIRRSQTARALRSVPYAALRGLRPGRGLDVGAGRGDLSDALQRRGWRMTAIEPSADATHIGRDLGLDARTGTLATVTLEQDAYEIAIFQQSLEHANEPVAELRHARTALRPGGLVLVSVPNFGSAQARWFRGAWFHLDLPRHRVHFTRAALVRSLERAGFVPESTATTSSSVGLAASIQYALAGRCLFPAGMAFRVAALAAMLLAPVGALLDKATGGGDILHAVGRRPDDRPGPAAHHPAPVTVQTSDR